MKKILLTGAAGVVGTALRNCLAERYRFRCLDVNPMENEDDAVVASVTDFEAVLEAMQGVDAVVHLASNPGLDQPWEGVYASGIGGTYTVFEAARTAGIRKVIYASSTAVLGWKEMQEGKRVSTDLPVHPRTLYGIGKATGELLARYYAEMYAMSIICLRIGSFHVVPPLPQSLHDDILRAWCSPEDLAQLVRRCLETDGLGFQVFYGVSANRRSLWDIRNARKLVGYRPESNAEDLVRLPKGKVGRAGLTREHAWLARAALQDGPGAFESWQRWLETGELENTDLDTLSYRLLPLVYYNLAEQNVDHPLMTRLKGVYRRAWLENQLSLQQVVPFINQLHEQGIPVVLLDDLTSILRLYDGQGARRPYSLDLLVRPDDLPLLFRYLEERNIWPKITYGKRFLEVETPLEIWPPFDLALTVTWRVHPSIRTPDQAAAAWQRAVPATLGECPVFTLDLESHFVRTCVRTISAGSEASFFALVDAAWMLRKQADGMDWGRVVELARVNHQVLAVRECLEEITSLLDMPKADELLENLRALPVSRMDRLEHRWVDPRHPFPGFFSRIGRRLLLYRRSVKVPGPLGFLRYLQYAWGGGRLLSLPRLAIRHFWNALVRSR